MGDGGWGMAFSGIAWNLWHCHERMRKGYQSVGVWKDVLKHLGMFLAHEDSGVMMLTELISGSEAVV